MLSKSLGQVMRIATVLHVLFHLDTPQAISPEISDDALKAALDFVELCLEHTSYLAGKGSMDEAIQGKHMYMHS